MNLPLKWYQFVFTAKMLKLFEFIVSLWTKNWKFETRRFELLHFIFRNVLTGSGISFDSHLPFKLERPSISRAYLDTLLLLHQIKIRSEETKKTFSRETRMLSSASYRTESDEKERNIILDPLKSKSWAGELKILLSVLFRLYFTIIWQRKYMASVTRSSFEY